MKEFEPAPESCHRVGQLTAKLTCELNAAVRAVQDPRYGKRSSSVWYHLSGVIGALRDIARTVPSLKVPARALERKIDAAKKSVYKMEKPDDARARLYPLFNEVSALQQAGKGLCSSPKV